MANHPVHARFDGPIVMIGFGSIGRGTLPLLERHIAVRPLEVRGDRPGRHRPGAARRAQAQVHQGRPDQGELSRGADPAAHGRARPRHDRQRLGRHLLGRPDGRSARTSTATTSTPSPSRGRASTMIRRSRCRSDRTMPCASACSTSAAAAPGRRHDGELLRRQPRHGVLVRQAGAARRRPRHRGFRPASRRPARNGRR